MGFLTRAKWEARRSYWTGGSEEEEKGYLQEEMTWIEEEEEEQALIKEEENENNTSEADAADDDMPNPMAMMDGMKGQFMFMIQNMVMMQGIGYFFQGYVLVKVPMPLTMGFKMMFQRGLDLTTLETSYVSSVSWYFLVMFGLRAFFRLVIEAGSAGQDIVRESAMIQADFGTAMAPPGVPQKFDGEKALKTELDNLDLVRYTVKGTVEDAERRLLGKKSIGKSQKIIGKAGEPGYDIFGVNASGTGKAGSKRVVKKKVPSKLKAT